MLRKTRFFAYVSISDGNRHKIKHLYTFRVSLPKSPSPLSVVGLEGMPWLRRVESAALQSPSGHPAVREKHRSCLNRVFASSPFPGGIFVTSKSQQRNKLNSQIKPTYVNSQLEVPAISGSSHPSVRGKYHSIHRANGYLEFGYIYLYLFVFSKRTKL